MFTRSAMGMVLGAAVFAAAPARGQVVVEQSDMIVVPGGGEVPPEVLEAMRRQQQGAQPAAAAATPSTQPANPEQVRLAALLAVKIDRKPPAIFNALTPKPAATQPAAAVAPSTQPATQPPAAAAPATQPLVAAVPTTQPSTQPVVAAAPATQPPAFKADPAEAQQFLRDAAAGNWEAVKTLVGTFSAENGQKLVLHVVAQLNGDPMSVVLPDDATALLEMFPGEASEQQITPMGQMVTRAFMRGNAFEPFVAKLDAGVGKFGGKEQAGRTRAALLLFASNRVLEAGVFLPALDAALAAKDVQALDLHARHQQTLGQSKNDAAALRRAWDLTLTVLQEAKPEAKERAGAFQRCLVLMNVLPKELGNTFLRETFKDRPVEAMTLLSSLATQISAAVPMPGRQQGGVDPGTRQRNLEMQKRVVDELLAAVGDDTKKWVTPLNVLVLAYISEADWSKQRYVNYNQYQYRNRYYGPYGMYDEGFQQQQMMNQGNEPQPINPKDLLKAAPSEQWMALVDPTLVPRLIAVGGELRMKAEDLDEVMPIVERLAAVQPKMAIALANELLRTWGRVKNPNQNQGYNPYMSMYGYYDPYGQQRGISLTRAAQERNLVELSVILGRLKALKLPEPGVDNSAVVSAFTSAHSQAEVYRLEDIEKVFGAPENVPDRMFAELVQTMRQRLAREWRMPQVQQQNKTKRSDKDMDAEVIRGYETLVGMLDRRAMTAATRPPGAHEKAGPDEISPGDWRAPMVRGAVMFDWAEFEYGKKVPLAQYTAKREEAFNSYKKAIELYVAKLPKLEEKEQSAQVFQQYFNSALGASDLQYLTRQDAPALTHIQEVKKRLWELPEANGVRERHLAAFGKALSDNLGTVPAELKAKYLRGGVEVMGDHASAAEARETVTYYNDLTNEVLLHLQVDGNAVVGHKKPFGVHISLRHSEAIGREAGGFNKYLTNVASRYGMYYQPMPGQRGPRDHRDEFEKKIKSALVETFDIVSITWHDEKVEPRGFGRPDWRETPLAYVLMKVKGPEVDKIPPLPLELEFADKKGPVVLPIESPVVLIDARPEVAEARPLKKVEVTQILDPRDIAQGKLTLEIKATGQGLLPELNELLDLGVTGLKGEKVTDQPMAVSKIDAEGDSLVAVTDRTWVINYENKAEELKANPTFKFPTVKVPGAQVAYKRYADADLEDVQAAVALKGVDLIKRPWWHWMIWAGVAAVVLAGAGIALAIIMTRRRKVGPVAQSPYHMPQAVTPFTVVDLLRRIHGDQAVGLSGDLRGQLLSDIQRIESQYFARANGNGNGSGPADPADVARQWLVRVG